ncbi:MAG: sigma-70 family RNA polymerase sigma factor [Lachnospiraceae bacterium]|nr:sigma-70 family RNA polymerase sigma factor [Lachnospiraceae bacterium]
MEDEKIIGLFWERNERAISETSSKYGRLCAYIADNILSNHEDSEECVNDSYLALWNAIPENRPNRFSVFLSRIVRNLALKKYEYISAAKRNSSAVASFEELGDCVSGRESVESEMERKHIEAAINHFLWQQGEEKRNVFIRRYWYFDSIEAICKRTSSSQSRIISMLYEMRQKLRKYLESEGIEV